MKQVVAVLLLFISTTIGAIATPPLKKIYPHRQPNGEVVLIQKHGDGLQGFYTNEEGMPLLMNERGALCYVVEEQGKLALSNVEYSKHSLELPLNMIRSAKQAAQLIATTVEAPAKNTRSLHAVNSDGLGTLGKAANGCVASVGEILIPVIMVEFPDKAFAEETTVEKVTRLLNEDGYSDEPFCKGSVRNYFESQSNGAFSPSFEVVAKVVANEGYAHYGKNKGSDIDNNVTSLIKEVVNKAEAQGTDFSKFVVNGKVPLVSIYYAGPGEHSAFEAGCEDYLWAHFREYSIRSNAGVSLGSYFIGNELLQDYDYDENETIVITGAQPDGIGVFCHEFSHALGLPDFYYTGSNTTVYDTLITMDFWSVMDYGQYAYDGYAPVSYTAYERCYMGWLNLVELSETNKGINTLHPLGSENQGTTAYLLRNTANEKEYYILENRQASNVWHPTFLGNGMLITHVDYDEAAWKYNRVNNEPEHQRMQYVPADGAKQSSDSKNSWNDYKGDLFPGTSYNYNFTDATNPASSVFKGNGLNQPIYDISEGDGVITFYYLIDKEASAINSVTISTNEEAPIFDIYGRRVIHPKNRGVYIQNGIKIIQ